MNTTVSMWLGISFLLIGIIATIIQAWLWRFPMVPDPSGKDPNGLSTAPKNWVLVHRLLGILFVLIYIIMMSEMVPRLWRYQVELPTRTVFHAVMGICIGFLLIVKISIIRWFQHFGKALPVLGTLVLLCTIILATLSIPYSIKAHGFGTSMSKDNIDRVQRLISKLELEGLQPDFVSKKTLKKGRALMTSKCTYCHDLRTIIKKPYPPSGWKRVVERMAKKPQLGIAIQPNDHPSIISYLVSITPDIQESVKDKRKNELIANKRIEAISNAEQPSNKKLGSAQIAEAKAQFVDSCSQCHELTNISEYKKPEEETWRQVILRMVNEQEAELEPNDVDKIQSYLEATYGK